MKEFGLEKFKNKMRKEALIKSFVFGFSSSLLLNSLVIIIFKLSKIKIHITYHIISFILLSILFTYLLYKFSFKENIKKTVDRLEENVKLDECVKTMVEFKDVNEPMVNIQRQDTKNKLNNVSEKQVKYQFSSSLFIFSIFSIITLVLSIVCPSGYSIIDNPTPDNNENSTSEENPSESDQKQEENETILFKATSSIDANVYFKILSYGDYNGKEFLEPTNIFDSNEYSINPMYLTSKALENNDYQANDIIIEVVDGNNYFLPYYTTNGPKNSTNDYIILEDYYTPYSLSYIQYDYLMEGIVKHNDPEYIALEAIYSEFVYDNYLSLPETTNVLINQIIDENLYKGVFRDNNGLIELI